MVDLNTEPELSEESAGLNQACEMDSEDISTIVVEHEEDVVHEQSITVAGKPVYIEPEICDNQTFVPLEKSTGKYCINLNNPSIFYLSTNFFK